MYYYQAYGLKFKSELECPQLLQSPDKTAYNVEIKFGDVPDNLENPKEKGIRYQAAPDHFILKVDNIAKYEVLRGNLITIEKHPDASDEDVRLFLYSTPFGALLQQRNILTLHCSAVEIDNKGILFCGTSGSGKSTVANHFIQNGAKLITDDIGAITLNEEKQPILYPSFPFIQLWADTIKLSGIDEAQATQTRQSIEKYYIPVNDRMCQTPVPVRRIYILSQYNEKEIKMESVTGIEKFNAIKNQTFRFPVLKGHKKESNHFKLAVPVANQTPITRLQIPRKPFSLEALTELLKKDMVS